MNKKYSKTLSIIYDYNAYKLGNKKRIGSITTETRNLDSKITIIINNGEKNETYIICPVNNKNEYDKIDTITTNNIGYAEKILNLNNVSKKQFHQSLENWSKIILKNKSNQIKLISFLNKNFNLGELKEISKKQMPKDSMSGITKNKNEMKKNENHLKNKSPNQNNQKPQKSSQNNTKKRKDDTFYEIAKRFREEMKEIEKSGILTLEELEKIKFSSLKETKNEICKENNLEKNNDNQIETEFNELKSSQNNLKENKNISNNEKTEKLFNENKNFMMPYDKNMKWIKIGLKDLALLPEKWENLYCSPLVLYSYKKYKHFLLGKDKQNLVLGIPGNFNEEEKSNMKILGEYVFKNTKNDKSKDFGYYIFKIN